MNIVKTGVIVGVLAVLSSGAAAQEYYVDPVNGNDGYDGLSAVCGDGHGPKLTVQAAVDLAMTDTSADDMNVVTLLPGDHLPPEGASACVTVTAPIVIRSRDGRTGRDTTRILGKWDANGVNGCGSAAVRCASFSASADGSRIEGVTLTGGATGAEGASADATNAGGGVYAPSADTVTLVDCAVTGCRALYGGALSQATAVRTLLSGNGATQSGAATYKSKHYNCVIAGNVNLGATEGVSISTYPVHMINCTFCGNYPATTVMAYGSSDTVVANCLIVCNGQYKTINVGTGSSSLKKSYLHACVGLADSSTKPSTYDGSEAASATELFSPLTDDWRLSPGAVALSTANVTYLETIPEAYRDQDFCGNPRLTGETLYCGAVQDVATPASGRLAFEAADADKGVLMANGRTITAGGLYIQSETWPDFVDVAYEETDAAYGLVRYAQGADRIWAFTNDIARLVLPPANSNETASAVIGEKIYAGPAAVNGSGDGSKTNPYTLQEAADVDTVKLILALPGEYTKPGTAYSGNNRVYVTNAKSTRILAMDGPEHTVIRGAADPQCEDATHSNYSNKIGLGPDTSRCVAIALTADCVIQAFTLADGHTQVAADNKSQKAANSGGGLFNSNASFNLGIGNGLADCVITNCAAPRGSATMGGVLVRCKIVDCPGLTAGIFSGCQMFATVATGCSVTKNGLAHNANLTRTYGNCTFVGNKNQVTSGSDFTLVNSILSGNGKTDIDNTVTSDFSGTVYGTGGEKVVSALAERAEAKFVDAANADWRLQATSPGAASALPEYLRYSALDITGRPYVLRNGHHSAGAYAELVPVVHIEAPACPGMTLSATGDQFVPEEGLTITLMADGGRNVLGFTNGTVTQNVTSVTITRDEAIDAAPLTYEVVYDRNLYVSPFGDDEATGFSWESARKTLAGIMAKAAAGDIVHADEGEYDSKTMTDDAYALAARVVVPAGVRLESRYGMERTVIRGARAEKDIQDKTYGLGSDAVRCVFMKPEAELVGFTITGGRTFGEGAENSFDSYGAGVFCDDMTPRIESCVISNNVGYTRTSVYRGNCFRCRIVGNRATAKSGCYPGAVNASLDTCLIADNIGGYNVNVIRGASGITIRNCSVGPHPTGSHALWIYSDGKDAVNPVINTLFFNGAVSCAQMMTNCVMESEACNIQADSELASMDRIIYGDTSADAEGRPVKGNAAIDVGDASLSSPKALASDLGGGQRVYGGRMDVGCWEFDWRPEFAKALTSKRLFQVDVASPGVVTNATGGVLIPSGETLSCSCPGGDGVDFGFTASAFGDGTLTAERNGIALASVVAGDGEVEVRADSVPGSNVFLFNATGEEGGGILKDFVRNAGLLLLVR